MRLDAAIEEVQEAEAALARELRTVGERHAAEHDVYHLAHSLARQCATHLELLAPLAERFGAGGERDAGAESPRLLESLRRGAAELAGRTELTGLEFLHDLRDLYLAAQRAELAWTMLVQGAWAARERELLALASSCQEDAQARAKWVRTRIKEAAPQVLAAG